MFGKGEKLHCIAPTKLVSEHGSALCVGYKTTSYAVFLPVYLRDDGYVLAISEMNPTYYELPRGQELQALQRAGQVPEPLPPYRIALHEYAFGYSLWLVILVTAVIGYVQSVFKRRRAGSLDVSLPPGARPLVLNTKTDRWLSQEATKMLGGPEVIQQQAYGYDREDAKVVTKAMYVVLTDRRLIVIKARIGAFGPLHENNGVTTYDRRDIVSAAGYERHVSFLFREGAAFDFYAEWSERHLSNQRRFLSDVPRLFLQPSDAPVSVAATA